MKCHLGPTAIAMLILLPCVASASNDAVPSRPLPDDEIALLKAQLASSDEFRNDILTTVYWSLGIAAAIALLTPSLLGYFSFRIYARDRRAIERDLRAMTEQGLAAARKHLDQHADDRARSLTKEIEARLDLKLKSISNRMERVDRGRAELSCDIQLTEARNQMKAGYAGPAALSYSNALEEAAASTLPWKIHDALEGIERSLTADASLSSSPDITSSISEALDKIPKRENAISIDRIRQLLLSSRRP